MKNIQLEVQVPKRKSDLDVNRLMNAICYVRYVSSVSTSNATEDKKYKYITVLLEEGVYEERLKSIEQTITLMSAYYKAKVNVLQQVN